MPTRGDLLLAGNEQKTRIIQRTLQGVDFDGRPFAPYSKKGPYYHYPGTRGGTAKVGGQDRNVTGQQAQQLRQFARRYGAPASVLEGLYKKRQAAAGRFYKKTGGAGSRTSLGVKYDSYEAFKFTGLGRSTVDLTGPSAPHMLQSIVVICDGQTLTGSSQQGLRSFPVPGTNLLVGIYGAEADRADGHNEGTRTLPQRRFLDASEADIDAFGETIANRILERVTRRR